MGRRKLPTLPQRGATQQTSASTTTNPPLYYSSGAAMDKPASTSTDYHIRFDSGTSRFDQGISRFDQGTPTSSRSILHDQLNARPYQQIGRSTGQPSFAHPIDPAILPGAQFRTPQQTQRQKPAILGGSKAKSLPTSPKISDTMSQLLFKQELRQALSIRRLNQETVEIEANHREFLIRRMLNSGLIPADCRREIDSIPQITKCDLPYELIAGARVVPPNFYEHQRRHHYGGRPSPRQQQQVNHEWPDYQQQQYYQSSKKSVACQYDVPPASPTFQRRLVDHYSTTTTPHSSPYAQRRQFPVSAGPKVDSATQTMVASETQTDTSAAVPPEVTQTPARHQLRIPHASNLYATTSTAYAAPDLLDATRRYFEEYDKRLRSATDAFSQRRQFQFEDAQSAQEMEWKQEQVRRELERRKQKVASMIDLRALQQRQNYTSIDQQDLNPRPGLRYGSLPRRVQQSYGTDSYSTQRPNYYGSLPRNFERGSLTNDLYDGLYPNLQDVYPQSQRTQYSRSSLGLDPPYQQQFNEELPTQRRPLSYDDLTGRQGSFVNDYGPGILDQTQRKQADDMLLSQYANYVNSQINAAGFLDDPYETSQMKTTQPYNIDLTPDYTPTQPILDMTTFDRLAGGQQSTYMPSYVQSQTVTPFHQEVAEPLSRLQPGGVYDPRLQTASYDPRLQSGLQYGAYNPNLQSGLQSSLNYDPRLSRTSGDYVYSRREQNYGSRPTQPIGNYGNYNLRSLRGGDPLTYPDYLNQNLQQPQRQRYFNTMPSSSIYSQRGLLDPMSFQGQQNVYDRQTATSVTEPPMHQSVNRYNNNYADERWPLQGQAQQLKPYSCSTQPRPQPQPYTSSMYASRIGKRAPSLPPNRWNSYSR